MDIMVTLLESTIPIATATGAAPEFYYLASAYSEDVQTARIEGPGVIKTKYFKTESGSSLGGSTVSLDPAKGDYLRFGGSLVSFEMVDPYGLEVLGATYPRLSDTELLEDCDGGKGCGTKRWRGGTKPHNVTFTETGCVRGDLLQGSMCQAVDTIPSLSSVNMPTLELQSKGIIYIYDWEDWAAFTELNREEVLELKRYTGYDDTLTAEPLPISEFYTAQNKITTGAGGLGYGYTNQERQATNGAGLYEDAAKLKITVTEGAHFNWLLIAAAAVAGIAVLNRSL
jgi:hypothetical protein